MKRLLLLRHGKSNWDVDVDDFHRPLKNRGVKAAQKMAGWMIENDLIPDYIVCSSAIRAKSTVEQMRKIAGFSCQEVQFKNKLYFADIEDFINVLIKIPEHFQRVMVVGHNPGLEELLEFLHKGGVTVPDDGKLLPTASLAVFTLRQDWQKLQAGCADLKYIMRPKQIRQ